MGKRKVPTQSMHSLLAARIQERPVWLALLKEAGACLTTLLDPPPSPPPSSPGLSSVNFTNAHLFTRDHLVICAAAKEVRNKSRPKNLKMIKSDASATDDVLSSLVESLIEQARAIHQDTHTSNSKKAQLLMALSKNAQGTKMAKGAGPCTSSFVLSHFVPDLVPFYCQKQWEALSVGCKQLNLQTECKFNEAQGAMFYEIVLDLAELLNEDVGADDQEKLSLLDISNVLWFTRLKQRHSEIWKQEPKEEDEEGPAKKKAK
ncbi:hypothetical protein BJ741DRAFT_698212 [Chytriomyces cf. hyalinus JEL632]|nr:hypothetical protein BJ741DRAFT_698212 [Chytriomyces cf. hyalinus JEL632]